MTHTTEQLRALAAKATARPWYIKWINTGTKPVMYGADGTHVVLIRNIYFIVALANAADELLAENERLRAIVERLPIDIAFTIRGSMNTYHGGHRDPKMLDAFQHGMTTASNVAEHYNDGSLQSRVNRSDGAELQREAALAASKEGAEHGK